MNAAKTQKISAIIHDENELETVITQLIAESVAFSDISVQGSPKQIKDKYGVQFIDPEVLQDSKNPPTKEAFLKDDVGWVISYSFTIPFIICIILGIFIIGDIRSTTDNYVYGFFGAIVGAVVGFASAYAVKRNYEKKVAQQEKKGGFVLWVTTHDPEQHEQVLQILKEHHPENIKD
ncbi:MAG: hypothetical protein EPN84_07380 [Legionella sp.]|nr:MAG: hypothetical protein EPN84_07380 [Legionella sp.]